MRILKQVTAGTVAAVFLTVAHVGLEAAENGKVAFVNFKNCVDRSLMGKAEQENFEKMKKQMEEVLTEKEKTLKELSDKISDEDYLESLSDEAQAELKHKFRTQNQELMQQQQQFFQVLQQANYKIIQKIQEEIQEAAKTAAKTQGYDIVMNEEGAFYFSPSLDISQEIVKIMDEKYRKSEKK